MREQAYRDPVHDFITITDALLQQLIDTPEFQRLRRIRQLGVTYGTYHGAEHSRFGHSLGAMWIMHLICERLAHTGVELSGGVREIALCAALLHDIGHGPLSHALERHLTPQHNHESWSAAIVQEDTAVHRILAAFDPALPTQVAAVILGNYQGPPYVRSLVSSQLDVDRMDYLLRDALYTGVTYGLFDLQRIINTMQIHSGQVVVAAKGIVAIEEYVLARYFMYWQVYLHKAIRSQELILRAAWDRALLLYEQGRLSIDEVPPGLRAFIRSEYGLGDYLALDDHDVLVALKVWRRATDPILADMARRFLNRQLLKPVFKAPHTGDISGQLFEARELVRAAGWDPEYYLIVDHTSDLAYDTYTEDGPGNKPPILAEDEYARPTEITKLSQTIKAVAGRPRQAVNVYVPAEVLLSVRALFQK
jgi:HD superfamily phosphohydrolase